MIEGECRPGRSRELARVSESRRNEWEPEDVSGVSGSDWETDDEDGGVDFVLKRGSEMVEEVVGDVGKWRAIGCG